MDITEAVAPLRGGHISRASIDHRRRDQNFFLLMVTLFWLGLLMGFVPEIARSRPGAQAFPGGGLLSRGRIRQLALPVDGPGSAHPLPKSGSSS